MTTPIRPKPQSDSIFESLSEGFDKYNKQITYGVIGVAILVGGIWFYERSQSLKSERAERAYYAAQQSIPGNLPLAQSDLRKLITRYDGTSAAQQARLTLAQLLFDENKFSQGIDELKKAMPSLEKSSDFAMSGHVMMAAGYEQLKKFNEAAAEYAAAAKSARFDQDRQRHESSEAHALLLAGKRDEDKAIWTRLGADSKGTVAGEARVRLGEMLAQPEPKS
jgi:predicted negative regulator of RcsB-dependent stress response